MHTVSFNYYVTIKGLTNKNVVVFLGEEEDKAHNATITIDSPRNAQRIRQIINEAVDLYLDNYKKGGING